jgi:nitroimidazol reductase NimA-like FMN-containing flavoprotein (pyridoxamine 5'-phosphate oxidase superfamily)
MRRKDKEIIDQKIIDDIFTTAEVCRIAMIDDGAPYIVPLNYGYRENALYVHSAAAGRKIDILKRNRTVCFEIETPSVIIKHTEPCRWGTKSRSLIGYGQVEIITNYERKKQGLDIIMAHYGKAGQNVYDENQLHAVVVLKILVESVTCKQLGDWD